MGSFKIILRQLFSLKQEYYVRRGVRGWIQLHPEVRDLLV